MQGLTNQSIDGFLGKAGAFGVDVTCNWYFMVASTFLCALVIGFVSEKIVEPRFGKYEGPGADETAVAISPESRKGLPCGLAVLV